jgi:hypothetical protein
MIYASVKLANLELEIPVMAQSVAGTMFRTGPTATSLISIMPRLEWSWPANGFWYYQEPTFA